ncbi:hypothetical protein Tco_0032811 [Tanacetum coccineum]
MAQLEFCDKLNMVAYLVKSESSEGFDEIIDFLTSSDIYYALTKNPIIFLITEDSLRRHLKLDDAKGISSLSNEEIFEHLAHMGSKKTAWDQFSSNIATTLICLATSRRFNFSKFIFEAMVKNFDSPHKFLLYPTFIQLLLNKQQRLLLPHTRTYPTPTLTSKLFSNMRRASKGYSGVVTPLFENMLLQAHNEEQQQSPSRITSSPSLSPQPTQPSPSPEPLQPTHKAEETASMPHDSPFHDVHSHGSAEGSVQQHYLTVLVTELNDQIDGLEKDLQQTKKTYSTALTKLVLRVKKLEYKLKSGKARRKAKIVISDDEEIAEVSSKQGRKISQIDEDPMISLVQDECEMKISTANIQVSTASPPKVSTVVPHVYTRRSAKDKRKAIMEEPATLKKVKRRTQVQLSMDEELARKLQEEERIRFNVPTQPTQSQGINWNDPSVLRYHALKNRHVSIAQARRNMITYLKNQGGYKEIHFKKMSYDDIRLIFERVWDHVNTFIPIGSEFEKDSSKPSEKETSKIVEEEKVKEEDMNPEPVLIEKKVVGIRRKTLARRRTSDKQGQASSKRQKKKKETTDYEEEKDELRMWLTVVPDEEEFVDP